jgi:hypothetical protein
MYAEHHRRPWFGDVRPMSKGDVDRSVGTAQDPDGTEGTAMLAAAIPGDLPSRCRRSRSCSGALGLHQLRLEAPSCSAHELTAPDTEQSSHGLACHDC